MTTKIRTATQAPPLGHIETRHTRPTLQRWASAALSIATLTMAASASAQSWTVTSPNNHVTLTVQLADLGGTADYPSNNPRLYYRVEHGQGPDRAVVIADSPLGLHLLDRDLLDRLQFDQASPIRQIEEAYSMPHGKRRQCQNRARHLTLSFRNPAGQILELDLRAYDDGAAFRYRLPGSGDARATVDVEATGFALPKDARLWLQPSDKATQYSPAYETYYENEVEPNLASPTGIGWSFPVMFRTRDAKHWGLITEAHLGPNYCGGRLTSSAPAGVYRIAWPDPAEGHGTGAVLPSSTLPWEMPWRLVILGDAPGRILESTLVTDLSEPARVSGTSWVRPGRVAWSWWSDPPSPQDGAKQRRFVDLAAEMGWEYLLIDANWTIMDNGNAHDVIRYAQSKGVGVLLWYNSGGPHNIVTEKPRDNFYLPEVRRFEVDLLHKWGVKGVKIDFFQSDKQEIIGLYHAILQDAAQAGIMVNFHGCTLPRGWSRTYPHLMAMEAVRGAECYIFDPKFPERAPGQNTITPFTRNAVGPMDYTPVTFSNNTHPHQTTCGHELALSVLFESGWVHFADKPEAYLELPPAPKEFLKKVPVAWDDTRCLAGYPGQFVILARRQGDTWYLAGVNGQNQPRQERIRPVALLKSGPANWTWIGDGADGRTFATETRQLNAENEITVSLLPRGGFVATLAPAR